MSCALSSLAYASHRRVYLPVWFFWGFCLFVCLFLIEKNTGKVI